MCYSCNYSLFEFNCSSIQGVFHWRQLISSTKVINVLETLEMSFFGRKSDFSLFGIGLQMVLGSRDRDLRPDLKPNAQSTQS